MTASRSEPGLLRRVAARGLLAAAVLGAGLGACTSLIDEDQVSFERLEPPGPPSTAPALLVSGQTLAAHSSFQTPCDPVDATATVAHLGSVLEIRVLAKRIDACASDVIETYLYRVTIRNLRSGTYTVKARHSFAGTLWPTEHVTLGTVTIP